MPTIVPLEHEIYRPITAFIAVFDAAGDSIRETHDGNILLCFKCPTRMETVYVFA